jgi:hypothetical protein
MMWNPTKRAVALAAIGLGVLAVPGCQPNVMTTGPTASAYSQTLAFAAGSPVMVSITNPAFNASTTVVNAQVMDSTNTTLVGYWTVKSSSVNGTTITVVFNTTTYKQPNGTEPLPGVAASGSILCINTKPSVGCPAPGSGPITITQVPSPLPCPCP